MVGIISVSSERWRNLRGSRDFNGWNGWKESRPTGLVVEIIHTR